MDSRKGSAIAAPATPFRKVRRCRCFFVMIIVQSPVSAFVQNSNYQKDYLSDAVVFGSLFVSLTAGALSRISNSGLVTIPMMIDEKVLFFAPASRIILRTAGMS